MPAFGSSFVIASNTSGPVLYIPDFRDEILDSERDLCAAMEEYLQLDWSTPGLVEEIEQQFPVSIEIDATNRNNVTMMLISPRLPY
jgi:hypothetical protein